MTAARHFTLRLCLATGIFGGWVAVSAGRTAYEPESTLAGVSLFAPDDGGTPRRAGKAGTDLGPAFLATLAVPAAGSGPVARGTPLVTVPRWEMHEFELHGRSHVENPFCGATLVGEFTSPSGQTIVTEGFYDGGDTWRLQPFDRMTPEAAVALAEPGHVYVIYLPRDGEMTVDLSDAQSPLTARWFNPRDGQWTEPFPVVGRRRVTFQAPDASDWVLHLSRQADDRGR